jgi:F0F1-type ATP synthase delta subunit
MSINNFRLAGRYVKAACVKYKLKPILREHFTEILNACHILLLHKNHLMQLKNKILELDDLLPESLYHALKLAILHNKISLLGDIFKYWCYYYQLNCQQLVDIYSAQQLDKKQQVMCEKFLQKYNDLTVNSQFILNKDLIAGIKIETPYLLFDNTVKTKINYMARLLKNYAGNI